MNAKQIIAALTKELINTSKYNNAIVYIHRDDYSISHDIIKFADNIWSMSKLSPNGYELATEIVNSIDEIITFIRKNP